MTYNPILAFAHDSSSAPAFDRIAPGHVVPAITQMASEHAAAMTALHAMAGDRALLAQKEAADAAFSQAWGLVGHLLAVASTPEMRAAHAEAQAIVSAHWAKVRQDKALYEAMASIPAQTLSPVEQRALDLSLQRFRLSGVTLEGDAAERFAERSQEASKLSTRFSNSVLDATQGWTLDIADPDTLAGLPDSDVASMAQTAKQAGVEGWRITLHGPVYMSIMSHAENRDLRRQVYEAYGTRASDQGPQAGQFDNSETMRAILKLRAEQAMALDFADPVALSLATKMASDADEVEAFLQRLAHLARGKADDDLAELRRYAAETLGITDMAPWDTGFVAERLRQERHVLDSEVIRQHLPLEQVLGTLFDLVGDLFAVELREASGVPVWHGDVRHFQVYPKGAAADTPPVAGFYADLFARNGKNGGAWMNICRARAGKGAIWPIAQLVANFAAPAPNNPALLSHSDMVTLFHEMGHTLHLLLCPVDVPSVAGTSGVEWDAVELPSQFLENFAWEPSVLKAASRHTVTGEPLSDEMISRMLEARQFQRAGALLRQVEFALFDLRLHRAAGGAHAPNPQAILEAVRDEVAVIRPPEWHRFAHSFSHIFAGSYAAGYYSYLWAERLSADAYAAFQEPGADRKALGARFRDEVLARGGSRGAMENFVVFRGREPNDLPLLQSWGVAA